MRVLQLAPVWETVPPPAYGGTEAVVSVLSEELTGLGVDVTLFASGDSQTGACLHSVHARSLRSATDMKDRSPYEWVHVARALKEGQEYDLIHNHAGELPMAMSDLVDVPMLTTPHNPPTADAAFVWRHYRGWYNTISRAARRDVPEANGGRYSGVIYNAIDVAGFPYSESKDDYLLFLSRISPEKGVVAAIQVARRVGRRLIIAAKIDGRDSAFFQDSVKPLIDGEQIVFVGEADCAEKRELYRRARCLLLPITWEEPFGLVMAEAMACGTPVIVFARGAAPEVVIDGETGFLVENVEGMVEAVRHVDRIDPARCRQHVEERFSPAVMTGRYLRIYRSILDHFARERSLHPIARRSRDETDGASRTAAVAGAGP